MHRLAERQKKIAIDTLNSVITFVQTVRYPSNTVYWFLPARRYASAGICYDISVCVSVSHASFVSKRLNVSSKFFYHLIAHYSSFFRQRGSLLNSEKRENASL